LVETNAGFTADRLLQKDHAAAARDFDDCRKAPEVAVNASFIGVRHVVQESLPRDAIDAILSLNWRLPCPTFGGARLIR